MKIKGVRIKTFGKLANKDIGPMDPGMTVFYGENESGKTTLKEFIRTTLFKVKGRKGVYPRHEKTDAGELDCVTDDGKEFKITRKGLSSSSDIGKMPEDLTGITTDVYQKVYAMNPEDLIDTKLVASGDIKRRFLTIPGGENMPEISENIDAEKGELLNESRIGTTKGIGKILEDIKEIEAKIEDAKLKGPEYERLASEKEEKEKELTELQKAQDERRAIIEKAQKQKDLSVAKEGFDKLTEERKTMDDADKAPAEGLEIYNELDFELKNALKKKENAENSYNDIKENIGDVDSESLIKSNETIRHLNENIGTHRTAESRISELGVEAEKTEKRISELIESNGLSSDVIDNAETGYEIIQRAETPLPKAEVNYIPSILSFLLGFLFTGIAAVTGTVAVYAVGGIMFLLGAVLIFKNLPDKETEDDFPDYIVTKGFPRDTTRSDVIRMIPAITEVRTLKDTERIQNENIADQTEIVNNLNVELETVMNAVGWALTSFENDVRRLRDAAESVPRLAEAAENVAKSAEEFAEASAKMSGYLAPYGSPEELIRIVSLKKERDNIDQRLAAFKEAMESYGVDPDEEIPEIPEDRKEEIGGLQRELGKIQRDMTSILNDSDTERLYDERSALEAERDEQIRRWGVLSLERSIVDAACDDIYENMQPAVIQTADRYLEMMTGGEYHMYNDPRTDEVAVITGTEVKIKEQWSSGLAGQVCLSLKLAVAKELSKETLPILLDDVLLVFDSERKKGACKALSEVAEEMQIVFFTCDKETREFMTEVGAEIETLER